MIVLSFQVRRFTSVMTGAHMWASLAAMPLPGAVLSLGRVWGPPPPWGPALARWVAPAVTVNA